MQQFSDRLDRVFMNDGPQGRYGGVWTRPEIAVHRRLKLGGAVSAVRAGREVHPTPLVELVVPDGRCHVLFDFGERPVVSVVGPSVTASELRLSGVVEQVGVEIAPGAVASLLGVSARTLRGQTVELADVLGSEGREWMKAVVDVPNAHRVGAVSEFVKHRLARGSPPDRRAAHAVDALERCGGAMSVRSLADEVALSARQLEQVFRDTVGLTPKEAARLSRFRALCRLMTARSTVDLAGAACDAGYADQAHASREVKRITGLTLTELRGRGFFQDDRLGARDAGQHDGH